MAHPARCPFGHADGLQLGAGTATILWLHGGVCLLATSPAALPNLLQLLLNPNRYWQALLGGCRDGNYL